MTLFYTGIVSRANQKEIISQCNYTEMGAHPSTTFSLDIRTLFLHFLMDKAHGIQTKVQSQ